MQRIIKPLALLPLALLALAGCELTSDVVVCSDGQPPVVGTPTTVQEVSSKLGAPTQTFSYNPAQANIFTSSQGTKVAIPDHAFVDANGNVVTTPVDVQLREVFDKATMVLTSIPTISGNRLLESAGEFYLAPQGNVKWAEGKTITLTSAVPPSVNSMNNMQLFLAAGGGPSGPMGPNCFQWVPSNEGSLAVSGSTITTQVSASVLNSGYEWINCDRYLPETPKDSVIIYLPGEPVDVSKNTIAFLLSKDTNTALRFCSRYGTNTLKNIAPTGTAANIVMIRMLNGKTYYKRQQLVVNGKQNLTFEGVEITPEALKDSLNKLN